jgi:hypothetical protein
MQLHPPTRYQTELQWRDAGKSPCKIRRGAAVVDGNMAYFMNWNGYTCSYDSSTQKWSELPECPNWCGSLAVNRGLLTAIGGGKLGTPSNKLLSMNSKGQMRVEHFPPMPTKRSLAAVVSTKQYLIVAGGKDESSELDSVEVMYNIPRQTPFWSTVASLPHPYAWASADICGDQLYMLGGVDKEGSTKSVLTCSLTNLLQTCSQTPPDSVWHRIADVPVYHSTCAAVNGELVAVGGKDVKGKTISAIYKYNPISYRLLGYHQQHANSSTVACLLLQSSQPMR